MASIDTPPQADRHIEHDKHQYTTIQEGRAYILVPHDIPTSQDPKLAKEETQRQQVFYNPIQQFNRDLSVLAIKTFGQDLVQRKTSRHSMQRERLQRKRAKDKELKEKEVIEDLEGTRNSVANGGEVVTSAANGAMNSTESASNGREPSEYSKADNIVDGVTAPKKRKRQSSADFLKEASAVKKSRYNGHNNDTTDTSSAENASAWRPQFSVLDALSATGLRALRYAQEIPSITSIMANDMSPKAYNSIRLNIKHNKLEEKITVNLDDAIDHMYGSRKKKYDVIDLDPYGTAAPFIDAAVQAVNDDGMVCVTCTDSAIFASHGYLEKTYSQYGGLPLKGEPCHEGGLRLILHAIASSAGRHGLAIEPLLSLSIDYYIRVFVRIRRAPEEVKLLAGKTMIVYHCQTGCGAWTTQFLARNKTVKNKKNEDFYKHSFAQAPSSDEHCRHCGFKTHLSGPMYGGPIHNVGFVERMLAQLSDDDDLATYGTRDRIEGMLQTALEEITFGAKPSLDTSRIQGPLIPKTNPADIDHHPFFIMPSTVSKIIHCSAPPAAALRGALRGAGFQVTMSHCKPGSIKTNASWKDIWHIMLEWTRQRAPLKNPLRENTAGYEIFKKARRAARAAQDTTHTVSSNAEINDPPGSSSGILTNGTQAPANELSSYFDVNFEVIFDEKLGKDHDRGKRVRYQLAPRENWGPMARAK